MMLFFPSLSPAEKTGAACLGLAWGLYFFAPYLSSVPLIFFVACCLLAPFFPSVSFYLQVISRGNSRHLHVALTFDDGPSPESTPYLLDLLHRHGLKATFFVIGKKAEQYPHLIDNILEQGHTIGNHSWRHDYLLMFRSPGMLRTDLQKTQVLLAGHGVRPLTFRPPVGITGPRLAPVLAALGMYTVNFSCRAFDRGNRRVKQLAECMLTRIRPGDILLLHDTAPDAGEERKRWKNELEQLLTTLVGQYSIVSLDRLIDRPVMEHLSTDSSGHQRREDNNDVKPQLQDRSTRSTEKT